MASNPKAKTPYPFQQQAITRIVQTPSFILADECGLGKTLTAIESVKRTRRVLPWRCLVICPPTLLDQWEQEIMEQDPMELSYVNRLPVNFDALNGYILMSVYDLTSKPVVASLSGKLFDAMIFDEAHRMKNRKTVTAKNVKMIPAARKIALTGTPMEKTPADLWSILNFVAPDDFPTYWGFVMKHLNVTAGYFEKYVIGGPKDPEQFGLVLSDYMLRRTKEEVAPELPEKIMIEHKIELTNAQKKLYDEIKSSKDILVNVEDKTLVIPNILSLLTKLQQISTDPHLLGFDVHSSKLAWLDEFLTIDHVGEPTVVFTRFREVALYIKREYGASIVIGGERDLSINPNLVVGTIDAMGEGLNFQWAKHAIFLDAHWSTIKMTQAIDRIHRINITEPKNLYFLWSTREDKLILDAFENKMSEAELVYYFMHE
jgi:SNF2 family DNA or RNA helicase